MEARDESHKQGSRSNASTFKKVQGSHDIYYDQRTGRYYRQRPNPNWEWGSKEPSHLYDVLPHPPGGTAYFVGEGDFSYSKAYAEENPGKFLKATSYDGESEIKKYPQGKHSLEALNQSPMVAVQHGVNVMLPPGSASGAMSPRPVDMLQFNFPHTGTGSGSADKDSHEFNTFVTDNQNLIRGFFKNAQHKVAPDGQVKFTYKKKGPYLAWEVEKIAGEEGWEEVSTDPFVAPKGYKHVLTKTADGTVGDEGAVTVTFRRKPATDATKTSLSGAVDADELTRRLSAIATGGSSGKTAKQTPAPKTSYHKEVFIEGKIKRMPQGKTPGFISRKGKKDVAFFNDGIAENPSNKSITEGTRLSFVIVEGLKGQKAIKIRVL